MTRPRPVPGTLDQGWMVDDGTCDQCMDGDCYRCTKPNEGYGDHGIELVCCCDEAYHIGYADPPRGRPMTIPGKIGPRLRQLRQARGFTLRETATAAGIHFTYLSKIENDHEPVGEDTLRALADILSADVEELLALAGKIPVQLQQRAVTDSQFALFLRRLPHLPRSTLTELYELVGILP